LGRRVAHILPNIEAEPLGVAVARPCLPPLEAIAPYIRRIDQSRWYSNFGPLTQEFEQRLAARFGAGAFVSTAANATQALAVALRAMDAPNGSLCMAPSWTFVATAHAIMQAGLVPWFVDVDADTWTLDAVAAEAALNRAPGPVGAVIPVCPFGALVDLQAWRAFRRRTNVPVLIDAAAAFDTLIEADIPACVSLHATKALGIGEGGFFVTKDRSLSDRFRHLTSFGFNGTRDSLFPATNAKLSEYASAVGHAALDVWPHERLRLMRAAQLLRIALTATPQVKFQDGWGVAWVSSTCVVTTPEGRADALVSALAAAGIETRQWWGRGCHASTAFAACAREALPNTEALGAATVGLPFSSDLTPREISRIAAALSAALA
jgi:dTDP-4-amino-4,6-dideoxygalactose transaminase